jgi:hypothetical protein
MPLDLISERNDEYPDGWGNFILEITRKDFVSLGGRRELVLEAHSTFHGDDVGISLVIPLSGWKTRKGRVERAFSGSKALTEEAARAVAEAMEIISAIGFTFGEIRLESVGTPTDKLLAAFERAFDLPAGGIGARASITAGAALLEGEPLQESGEVKTKLFFEPDDQEAGLEYCELYLNYDLGACRLRILEKDGSYRKALLGWLRSEGRSPNKFN